MTKKPKKKIKAIGAWAVVYDSNFSTGKTEIDTWYGNDYSFKAIFPTKKEAERYAKDNEEKVLPIEIKILNK